MNQEKAREFFSSYYEGTLDPGLKQALEHAMGRDARLREDYQQFENAYEDLGSLKFETIEIPFDLNDKILANIDLHVYESRKSQQPSWLAWLRNAAIAGVSCVAILGAVISLRSFGGEVRTAGNDFTLTAKEELTIDPSTNHEVNIHFAPLKTETLVIREGLNGEERRRTTVLEGKELITTLENPTEHTTVFELETGNDPRSTIIALPGSGSSTEKTGTGNLEDFAKALAGYYRVAVEVRVTTPTVEVAWDFKAPDALNAAMATLNVTEYALTRRHNNLLVISEK